MFTEVSKKFIVFNFRVEQSYRVYYFRNVEPVKALQPFEMYRHIQVEGGQHNTRAG